MHKFPPYAGAAALVIASFMAGTSQASPSGAFPGLNGSPASFGTSCTLCHNSFAANSGPGSTTVLDLPSLYVPDQTYILRVRVQDDTQAGAGFQVSVEDPTGVHMGELTVSDPVNTRNAAGGGALLFITHTDTGRLNALNDWASLGNAAEFSFQWRAPTADMGPIGFYTAGNATDNSHSSDGDRIYISDIQINAANPGDINGDGAIDTADLGILLGAFGSADPVADINNDGVVDTADLGVLLGVFGS